jgi:flagellar motor switch protein FliM
MAMEPLLRPEEVASVLSPEGEAGGKPAPASPAEASTSYSLRRPVAIAAEDEPAARRRLETLSAGLQAALCRELESDVGIEVLGFQQEQAGVAVKTLPQPAWILGFAQDGGGGIALALDPTGALSLVEIALGGAGNTAATGREPTALERRVLNKLCAALVGPLAARSHTRLARGTFEVGGLPPALAAPGETVALGLLKLRFAGAERSGLLLVTPRLLAEPARPARPGGPSLGPLAPRLDRVGFELRPVLDVGLVPLCDLRELRPGSLLRFDVAEGAPFALAVNGHAVLRGHLVREQGRPVFKVLWRRGSPATGAIEGTS